MSIGWILAGTFLFLVFFVGGYMFLMLNVMRVDPHEQKYRKKHGETTGTIIPKSIESDKESK